MVMLVAMADTSEPLPTTMEVGEVYREAEVCERVPSREVMWEVAHVSRYQSLAAGWVRLMLLNVEASEFWSHIGDHTMGR